MSELASEMSGGNHLVSTSEFLGSSFAERRAALEKVNAFRSETRQAYADSIAAHIGRRVLMTFSPSTVYQRGEYYSIPMYRLFDKQRTPVEKVVSIQEVDAERFQATIGEGELVDGQYDRTYSTHLNLIYKIEEIE